MTGTDKTTVSELDKASSIEEVILIEDGKTKESKYLLVCSLLNRSTCFSSLAHTFTGTLLLFKTKAKAKPQLPPPNIEIIYLLLFFILILKINISYGLFK